MNLLTPAAKLLWDSPETRGTIEWYLGYSMAMHWVRRERLWARRYRL